MANTYVICLSNLLLDQENEEEHEELTDRFGSSVPDCGANLSTPVIDRAYYINEIQYRIGDRLYIENAD